MSLESLRRALGDQVAPNEPMSRHTTFGIGGPADLFMLAQTIPELCRVVGLSHEHEVPYLVVGCGANILVSDKGVRGLVIRNVCCGLTLDAHSDGVWLARAESGAELKSVADQTLGRGLAGLEWAVGVPGTVGGAVVGNAGAYGGYVSDNLRGVEVYSPGEGQSWWSSSRLELGYRTSVFKHGRRSNATVICAAVFSLREEDPAQLERRASEYRTRRSESQPSGLSAGSVFKRTAQYPAGFLIENAGLKGARVGGAMVSPKHANFILNTGTATAEDVRKLLEMVRQKVRAEFGIELEPEIELVGEW